MRTKEYRAGLELKAGDAGAFEAVFARLQVVDHDNDVTLPGAFRPGQHVGIEPWNHAGGLPVGRGQIYADSQEARVKGRFFLDTAGGRETYATLKELGSMAEWSYTFRILDAERGTFQGRPVRFLKSLDVVGVGPVARGAGIQTRTVAIKGASGWASAWTPAAVLGQILELGGPAAVNELLEEDLLDLELEDLRQKLASSEGRPAHPTNRDAIRARLVAERGADHSPAWLEAMVSAQLQDLVHQEARRRQRAGVGHNVIHAEAAAAVARWAGQPARAG